MIAGDLNSLGAAVFKCIAYRFSAYPKETIRGCFVQALFRDVFAVKFDSCRTIAELGR